MNICLYGSSSNKIDKIYITKVEEFGKLLASRGHNLVFGGGGNGLMGAAARGVDSIGGNITGVAPSFFKVDGVLYDNCTEFFYTDTMRTRKQKMEELSDAFVVTPGGIGTFEEFFEILTLKQLGRHSKPIAVFNINGYYDDIRELIEKAISEQFMPADNIHLCEFFDDGESLLHYLETGPANHEPGKVYKTF